MIKSITVTNYLDETIVLEMRFPEKSGFLIKRVDGLGPVKANINITEIATGDGGFYNSARATSRNIVMKLGLLFDPTIEDTRQKSYKYFPLKKKVRLIIETDNRICETYGYVESNEPDIFSKDETANISIICPDSYLYSTEKNTTIFYGVEPAFEFEFSNESLTENMIEFGVIEDHTIQTIYYDGDAEVGITIHIHAIGDVSNLAIWNTRTRGSIRIDSSKIEALTGSGIVNGDDIIITTDRNNKSIQLVRNGVYTNILNCLNRNADWFRLSKGDNVFAYTADYGLTNIDLRIEHSVAYEGI